ncbi:Receptor-like protein kinase HERK 1 [Apostasia shenzhenica]|uniref:Receptor-like protein kinase HERK 1 n=1 Tax=Apostasia shenzhenica TaxID=1088818 RepID=A0A2I0A0G7_9ASPA|nr:Receptor-like protein kinase HERK 1 [Apostasia shenzhenica]
MAETFLRLGLLLFLFLLNISDCCIAFTPADNYLIDCGSLTNTTIDRRVFVADTSLSWRLKTPKDITANNTRPSSVSSLDSASLYLNARIFTGASSYSFPIRQQGKHFIRLFFFPFDNQDFNLTTSKFSVSTQDSTLLLNFQPLPDSTTSFKEFLVNIAHDNLILNFVPARNSVAFISALEVVSMPENLILDTAQIVKTKGTFQGLAREQFEMVYRLNMGGPKIFPESDTLSRTWHADGVFLVDASVAKNVSYSGPIDYVKGASSPETAPKLVYSTAAVLASQNATVGGVFNVTWKFSVESGFNYLVRMHFCDIVSKALNELYFNAYINSLSAASNIDLSAIASNSLHTVIFMDFVIDVPSGSNNLSVTIGPSNMNNADPDGLLNGLEIMKMGISGSGTSSESSSKSNIGAILGGAFGAIAVLILAVVIFCSIRRKKVKKHEGKSFPPSSINGGNSHILESKPCVGTTISFRQNTDTGYRFSIAVLQEATNNFDENLVIGVGGFGKVYKGVLRDEMKVAVKRGNPKSQQGLNEFHTEIELLPRLRHRHLVSLIGYCDERNEMILVYEYMEKGNLRSHLYGSDLPSLTWKQRLEICIGSARGLHYLHTGSVKAIIHRDVKSANILLDENLVAKVSDFGLSKTGPELGQTHVSTAVKGSFGYLDPEYFRRQQLTEKSDVYSFGVVMLEVICARPVIDPTLTREMVNLKEWGMTWQQRGELDQIVDPRIAGDIKPNSLRKFGEIAEKCLADFGVERPSMGDVLWNLEYAMQLQETEADDAEVNSINNISKISPQIEKISSFERSYDRGIGSTSLNDLSDMSMSRVFSQLIKADSRHKQNLD